MTSKHHREPVNESHAHELLYCELIMEGRLITLVECFISVWLISGLYLFSPVFLTLYSTACVTHHHFHCLRVSLLFVPYYTRLPLLFILLCLSNFYGVAGDE